MLLVTRLAPSLVCVCLACGGGAKAPPGGLAVAAAGWYRGDLHYHTNHSEDARRQGGDDVATALAIADAYRDPIYLAAHPEHVGDALDFVAVTDHRTDAPIFDPAFRHDFLFLIPGEEYGGAGHANVFGLRAHIPHEPRAGESQAQRHRDAIAEAHAQGALFSPNHPCQENSWIWELDAVDALEVWNAPWSAFWGEITVEDVDRRAAEAGYVNPYLREGVARGAGGGPNAQALHVWYGMLARGRPVAVVGGSDRHMVLAAGHPTTYVQARAREGILAGIRAGATFVSRSPHAAQVVMEAIDAAGVRRGLGSRLAPDATYTLEVRVGRARGGLLRLVGGPIVALGTPAPAPEVLLEKPIRSDLQVERFAWRVRASGGWVHALVLEPRVIEPLPVELEPLREATSRLAQGRDLGAMAVALATLVGEENLDILFDGSKCDPAGWSASRAQCVPADRTTGGTFYLPDAASRLLNTYFDGGQATEWCMGALTSAIVALP